MIRSSVLVLLLVVSPLFGDDEHTITATGMGKQVVKATIADVRLGVETQARGAREVEGILSQTSRPILEKLRELAVDKLEVGSFSIYPEYSKGPSPVILQYRGTVQISFSTPVDRAGDQIDQAVQAGANRLYGVTVRPTDETIREGRLEALREAAVRARQEAQTVLAALGLEEKQIIAVTVDPKDGGFQPRVFRAKAADMESTAQNMEILEQEHEITARVSLEVEY